MRPAMATAARPGPWARKSHDVLLRDATADPEHGLKRSVGVLDLTALGIGAVIGTGIFVIIGEGIGDAGPSIIMSFALAGVTCLFSAFSYAELASSIPVSGSAYTYGYATLGELVAWIIGWDLILEYLFGAATVAVGWAGYFTAFMSEFGIRRPAAYAQAPYTVVGTHTLVRNQVCVDSATGTAVTTAVGQACQGVVHAGVINIPAIILIL